MLRKNSSGFIAIVPLVLIAAVLIVSLSFKSGMTLNSVKTAVLSESDEGSSGSNNTPEPQKTEEPKGDSSGSKTPEPQSTEKPSRSGSSNTSKTPESKRTEVQNQLRIRTPKPSETPRNRTPKPSETPEVEDETEIEIETEVKDGTTTAKIKIQQNGRSFQFEHEGTNVQVQGEFPVSVDSETNVLTITTPEGVHDVAVLPDIAVDNMLATGEVTEVEKDNTGREDVRIIADSSGNPVYEVRGVKVEKLLGLFNVPIEKKAHISLKDGSVVTLDQSFISRVLDLVSF